jgi:hypothetical protein
MYSSVKKTQSVSALIRTTVITSTVGLALVTAEAPVETEQHIRHIEGRSH